MLRKIRRKLRESGPLYTVQYGLSAIIPGRIFAIESSVVLAKLLLEEEVIPSNESFMWISLAESDMLATSGYTKDQLETRFSEGALAAVARQGDRIIACSWYAPTTHRDVFWIRFSTSPEDVWNWDVWVDPSLRGRGIAGRLLRFAHQDLRTRGYSRVVNTVDKLNRNSLRAFTRAGYIPLGEFFSIRLFGWTLIRADERWHFGRFSGRSPFVLEIPSASRR